MLTQPDCFIVYMYCMYFIHLGHHVILYFTPNNKKRCIGVFIVKLEIVQGIMWLGTHKSSDFCFSLSLISLELSTFSWSQVLLALISTSLTDHHGNQEWRQDSNTGQAWPNKQEGKNTQTLWPYDKKELPVTGLIVWTFKKLNQSKSVTDPIQQEHSTFIHVEMGFDALRLCVCVLLKAAAYSRQFDCGQVQRAKHTGKHSQPEERTTRLIFKYIQIMREHIDQTSMITTKQKTQTQPWKLICVFFQELQGSTKMLKQAAI